MPIELELYHSIDDVPSTDWDSIAPHQFITLDSRHLSAIEASGINNIQVFYVVARRDGCTVGIAHFFIFQFDMSSASDDIPQPIRSSIKQWYPSFLSYRVMECGFISSIGESSFAIDEVSSDFYTDLATKMENIAQKEDVDFILVRDVSLSELERHMGLEQHGYIPFLGYPSAEMSIRWNSFDDYISSLTSKQKKNVRTTMAALENQEISVEIISNFENHANECEYLWNNVNTSSGDYQHERLDSRYFAEMSRKLGESSFIVAIKRYEEIVSFGLCLHGNNAISFLHAGIDYRYNKKYQLYFNLFIESIREAIRREVSLVDFGITTYFYKCKLGCELNPLVYYVKHLKSKEMSLSLAGLFREIIKQPENFHRPFHHQDISERVQLSEYEPGVLRRAHGECRDIFYKAYIYTRMGKLRFSNLYTFFPPFESAQEATIKYRGKEVVLLGTNSYLGLANHPRVKDAAKSAIDKYGTGCSGSPILNGTTDLHVDLIQSLAKFVKKDDAILVGTGYQANVAVITGIAGRGDAVVIDELNHASLIDGARFARSKILTYKHNDIDSLETALKRFADTDKIVVVDSLFSMEGTIVDLPRIVEVARKYGARVMVDEAHAIGVMGPGGRGVTEMFGLLDEVDLIMGTFSKSFGAVGGFVAGDAKIIDYLRHVCRPHIFSASLPPPVVAAVRESLEIIKEEPERRDLVLKNARFMAEGLQKLGYEAPYRGTSIVPIYCRNEVLTLALYKKLIEKGIFVNPVLSPAVPKGQELLRTSYMATHTREMLERSLQVFADIRTNYFPVNAMSSRKIEPNQKADKIEYLQNEIGIT